MVSLIGGELHGQAGQAGGKKAGLVQDTLEVGGGGWEWVLLGCSRALVGGGDL